LKLKAIRIKTKYWRPGTDYIQEVVDAAMDLIQDGDIVTISEKAISTAQGRVVNESQVRAGKIARFLATFWTRRIWGGPLGRLTKLRESTLRRLRGFPEAEGSAHKQVSLWYTSILQSLRHYSEGGIDVSNLPYSLVSLPLETPRACTDHIRKAFAEKDVNVSVMIVDGDTTYSWRNLHLAPRRVQIPGLAHLGGFLTFVVGRMLGFRSRSTPIALSGEPMNPDWVLTLANVAHRVRGYGAGRTVWDMIERLGTGYTGVTWEMLDRVDHYPIVILRKSSIERLLDRVSVQNVETI
jgi:F420-0:gamma-glutamyl ligase-like protein